MISLHTSPLSVAGVGDAGGLNVYVREAARALAQLGWAVDIYTRLRTSNARTVVRMAPDVRVITLPAGVRRPLAKQNLAAHTTEFAQAIAAFAHREGTTYDVIHGHYWLSGLSGLYLRDLWDIPMIQMFHTLSRLKSAVSVEDAARARGEQRIISHADAIVTATDLERQTLVSAYDAPHARIMTIPCGVDTDVFFPTDVERVRRRLNLEGKVVVVSVGRFDPLKGFETLIAAIAQVVARSPELADRLRVYIIGGPPISEAHEHPYRAALLAQRHTAGLDDIIHLPGPMRPHHLRDYLQAATVSVVPSLYESFGLAALEAMACGVPVLASDVGGLQTLVLDGVTGSLFPVGDVTALSDRLIDMIAQPARRDSLGRTAAKRAACYSWRAVAEQLSSLYCTSLNRQRSLTRI